MAYANYNYPEEEGFSYSTVIYVSLGLSLLAILLWFWWATNYRYSLERIENKLLTKYTGPLANDESLIAKNVAITDDKKRVTGTLIVRKQDVAGTVVAQSDIVLPVRDDCSPISKLCVNL